MAHFSVSTDRISSHDANLVEVGRTQAAQLAQKEAWLTEVTWYPSGRSPDSQTRALPRLEPPNSLSFPLQSQDHLFRKHQ